MKLTLLKRGRGMNTSNSNRAGLRRRDGHWAALVLAALAASAPALTLAQGFYQLESALPLKGAAPGWDYLSFEPARSHLFIGRRQDGVTVYDTRSGKVVGSIENSQGANMATLVSKFDRGYTTNGDGSTTVFQLSTLKTIDRIKLGESADAAYFEPVTGQLAFMMGDDKQITFVDAASGAITGKLALQSEKIEAGAADGQGNLFVSLRDRNEVIRIDARKRQVTAEWKTQGCEQPTGLAFDAADKRIFAGCRGNSPVLAVLDAETGKVVATPVIGRGNDGVVFDAETHRIYTSNGVDANIVIYDQVDPNTYKLKEAVTTRPVARTMALDPVGKKLYTVTAEGVVDPSQPVNRAAAPFYPNRYFDDTFTLLTYSLR